MELNRNLAHKFTYKECLVILPENLVRCNLQVGKRRK